eukprot:TRINITY_DN1958_c0_g2_i1.p1 TRINITY_DN1958_c0_g2~~TRINITY_DN1958_c0_g2_i1.p1  ORF type:complete len:414 (-),score=68.81 TRINITY_DN1958_c0_g2_i1:478-1680(-)
MVAKNDNNWYASRPLWEAHVISNRLGEVYKAAIIIKVHHSVCDVTSLTNFLSAHMPPLPAPELNPFPSLSAPSSDADSVASDLQSELDFVSTPPPSPPRTPPAVAPPPSLWTHPLRFFRALATTFVFMWRLIVTIFFVADVPTKIKQVADKEGHNCQLAISEEMSMDDVARIARAVGDATTSDVAVAVLEGGIRRYLRLRDGPHLTRGGSGGLDAVVKKRSFWSDAGVHALSIVKSTQPSSNAFSPLQLGNSLGFVLLPLQMERPSTDPLQAVRNVRSMLQAKGESFEASWAYSTELILSKLRGSEATSRLRHRALSQTSLSFSTVTGPTEAVTFGGVPLAFFAPMVTGLPQALSVHAQTYMNTFRMVVHADASVILDPEVLCDCFVASFNEMRIAAAKT